MFLDRLVRLLLPRQGQFFKLLEGMAAQIEAAATVFAELGNVVGHPAMEEIAARLKEIEKEADGIDRDLHLELDKTFVTPIDREDLAALTKALDDVVDGMEHTAAFAALYQFRRADRPDAASWSGSRSRRRAELAAAVRLLRRLRRPGSRARGRPGDPHPGERGRRRVPAGRRGAVRRRPVAGRPGPAEGHARHAWKAESTCARTRWTSSARWW